MNADQRQLYTAVIAWHARLRSDRKVMRCQPSRAEQDGSEPRKEPAINDGRPIFDTQTAADAVVAELHGAGANPQEVYQCRRGSGHWHFRTVGTGDGGPRHDGRSPR